MVGTRRAHVRKSGKGSTGFDKILVPLDGSEFAERALPYVQRLERTDAEVILLRAVASASQLAASAGAAPMPGMTDFVQLSEDSRREAQTYLDAVATRLRERGVRSRVVVVLAAAAEAITRAAEESKVDVIAITSHGRSGIERVVFGSVADAVVRNSTRPVFVVPMRQADRDGLG